MLIGELSKRAGLSRDTIRYYERRGLISSNASTSRFNNYKDYGEKVVQRLNVIKQAKAFGFSLNEIAELLSLMDIQQANCGLLEEKVRIKVRDIDRKIEELKEMKHLILTRLQEAIIVCAKQSHDDNCAILSRG